MVPFDQLYQQQHEISELSNLLCYVIQDRELCDNSLTSKMFQDYIAKVRKHLDLENSTLYSCLLTSNDKKINNIAKRNLEGGKEVNKMFKTFVKRWDRNGLRVGSEHTSFVKEAHEMIGLVLDRIQRETEELYPLARKFDCAA